MRTTIAFDDDVFLHARCVAQERRVSLGVAVSSLLREGIRAQQHSRASLLIADLLKSEARSLGALAVPARSRRA